MSPGDSNRNSNKPNVPTPSVWAPIAWRLPFTDHSQLADPPSDVDASHASVQNIRRVGQSLTKLVGRIREGMTKLRLEAFGRAWLDEARGDVVLARDLALKVLGDAPDTRLMATLHFCAPPASLSGDALARTTSQPPQKRTGGSPPPSTECRPSALHSTDGGVD